jgi:hypothetical protein
VPTVRLPSLPLWEAEWPADKLAKKKASGERAFAQGFHLRVYAEGERMFPSFADCISMAVRLDEVLKRRLPAYVGVDLASSKRPGNVIFVLGIESGSLMRYPLEILRGAWSSPETAARLAEVNLRHDVRVIMVEDNGYQKSLVDWLRTMRGIPGDLWMKVEPYTTTAITKRNQEIGLPSMEVELKNGGWAIPEKHPPPCTGEIACPCSWCTWKREMKDYPHAAQTDTVLGMYFAREAAIRWASAGMAPPSLGDTLAR